MKNRLIAFLLILLTISSFVQGQENEFVPDWRGEQNAGDFVYADCPFYILPPEVEGETVDCGYLFVPENRSQADSPIIQLAVMAIYATGSDPYEEPIIYLEGGPGGSAIANYEYWYTSSLREDFDIILIDQRGTGFSLPSLNCPEIDEAEDYIADCASRLRSEGVNLAAYNSEESAHDIGDLIQALEYTSVNLYGTSYGSRLALTVMRERPENLRSVILEAVYPPNINAYDESALVFWNALQNLFAACQADSFCSSEYPELEATFFQAMNNLNTAPIEVEDFETGNLYDMDGYAFADDIFLKMYEASWLPSLPALIYAAAEGDADAFIELSYIEEEEGDYSDEYYEALDDAFMDYLGFDDYEEMYDYTDSLSEDEYFEIENAILGYIDADSEGMYTSVECFEEVPFNSLEAYDVVSVDVPDELVEHSAVSVDSSFADCEVWGVDRGDAIENEIVRSDIPTLIISGELDPITPPSWGTAAEEGLSNSYHYIYPAIGHGGIDSHECPTNMALEFLDNPAIAPDDSCMADMAIDFE